MEDGQGLLRGSSIVEIDQLLAVDLQAERRKILPDPGDVVGAVQDGRVRVHALASSQRSATAITASRKSSSAMPSIASPTKAWISRAWASFSGRPRARR